MSDVPPDGRNGGLVPLTRVEDLFPEIGDQNSPTTTFDFGNSDDTITVNGEELPINELSPIIINAALADIEATGSGNSAGIQNPITRRDVSAPLLPGGRLPIPTGIRSPVSQDGPAKNIQQALIEERDRQQSEFDSANKAEEVRRQQEVLEYGSSHPQLSQRSLVDQVYGSKTEADVSQSSVLGIRQRQADSFLSQRSKVFNAQVRNRERSYRNSIVEIQEMRENGDLEFIDSDFLDRLTGAYEDAIGEAQDIREAGQYDISVVYDQLSQGDFSSLPERMQPSDREKEIISRQVEETQFAQDAFDELLKYSASDSITDRMVVESVRGLMNQSYSSIDVFRMAGRTVPLESAVEFFGQDEGTRRIQEAQLEYNEALAAGELTPAEQAAGQFSGIPILSNEQQSEVIRIVGEITGRDQYLDPTDGPGLNPNFFTEEQLGFVDTYRAGGVSDRQSLNVVNDAATVRLYADGLKGGGVIESDDPRFDFLTGDLNANS